MKIAVATAAFVPHGGLDACVRAALGQWDPDRDPERGHDFLRPSSFLIVVNGGGILEEAERWARHGVQVWRPGRNLGCSAAWNRACRWAFATGHDAVLIVGDDVVLDDPWTLQRFADAYRDGGFRQMRFVQDRGFSAVCVTRAVWDEVGGFDEGFWPAYFEDNDYWLRFHRRGIAWDHVLAASDHLGGGSSSIRSDPEVAAANATTFSLNRDYFVAKWGGMPTRETYAEPWNGGPARPGTREVLLRSPGGPEIVARVERAYGPEEPWPW